MAKSKSTGFTIDPEVKDLLMEQARNLIEQIRGDILNDKQLSEETKKNCQSILDQAQRDYTRYLIIFLEETQILVNNARQKPASQRAPIQNAWKHAFDVHVQQCKKVVGPILHVLNVLVADSKALQTKYRLYLAGGVFGSVIVGASVIGLVIHLRKAATLCSCTALVLALFCGCMNTERIRKVYERCTREVQLWLIKAFPDLFNDSQKPITADELEKLLAHAINILRIDDQIWSEDETLESLNRLAEKNLKYLHEKP